MASDIADYCDAVLEDLTTQVPELAEAKTHRYAPWSPEQLEAQAGEKHVAVWPAPEGETAEPFTTHSVAFTQTYVVLVWEDATSTSSRAKSSEDDDRAFLELHSALRARWLATVNLALPDGNAIIKYAGTQFPGEPSAVRWFAIQITNFRAYDMVA